MTREAQHDVNEPDEALRERLRRDPPHMTKDALDDVFASIEADVHRADRHPLAKVRSQTTRTRRAVAVASFIAIFAFASVTNPRPDLALYPIPRLIIECAAYVVLLLLSVFAAVRSEAMPLLSRGKILALVGLGLVAAVVLATVPAPHSLPIHLVGSGPSALWTSGSPCMYVGLTLGIPVYIVMRLIDRGSPLGSVLAASAAGLLANLVLQVHCPVTSVGHRLVGHASIGPILLTCLSVALLFERFVISRRQS